MFYDILDEGHGVFGEQDGRLLLKDGFGIGVETLIQSYHDLLSLGLGLQGMLVGLLVLVRGVAMR